MEYKKLSEIADIVSGYAIPSDCMADVGTPILKITNIREDNTIDLENTAKYTLPIEPKLNKFLLRDKDILVCMTGATIGKVARKVKVEGQYIVNQRVAIIRPKNPKDSDFVYYILKEPTFRRYVELVGYGAAQPNISASAIGKFCFACDDKLSRISIDSILSAYDNLIELNTRRIKLLEQMAENLYKEWFAFSKIKNNLEVVKLKSILSIVRGLSYSSSEIDCEDGVNLINLKNIKAYGGFRFDGTKRYNGKYKKEQIVKSGDLVMGVTDMTQDRRTVGSVALIPNIDGIAVITADLIKIESKIDNIFLFSMFKYGNISRHISQFANGANVLHLRPQAVENIRIYLPNVELINKYVSIVKPLFSEIATLQTQSANLTRQRDLLLPRLMSGQLPTQ